MKETMAHHNGDQEWIFFLSVEEGCGEEGICDMSGKEIGVTKGDWGKGVQGWKSRGGESIKIHFVPYRHNI